jgi:hypothetical protein
MCTELDQTLDMCCYCPSEIDISPVENDNWMMVEDWLAPNNPMAGELSLNTKRSNLNSASSPLRVYCIRFLVYRQRPSM